MLQIVSTADGSKTIFNSEVGESYHSKHGAIQESRHVFIGAGLAYFSDRSNVKEISILEVGFGTGLNFLLSADFCESHQIKLDYTGIEAFPLSPDMIGQTGYEEYIKPKTWQCFQEHYSDCLAQCIALNPQYSLQIALCKLAEFSSAKHYDIIYFDAFASMHQPEMWTETAIGPLIKLLNPGGVFVTYAITGQLRRMLKGLGLEVQKAPGAPGKREMLRAIRH